MEGRVLEKQRYRLREHSKGGAELVAVLVSESLEGLDSFPLSRVDFAKALRHYKRSEL